MRECGDVVDRLWRPAAQRQVRNALSALHAQRSEWGNASSAALPAASGLVNSYLTHRYVGTMDLGVLQDMEGLCTKSRSKLRHQQETHLEELLATYGDQVRALSTMLHASKSMRTYIAGTGEGPLINFSSEPSIDGDNGDGAGAPVFASLPLTLFEMLANEVVAMYNAELKLKWLLVSEFQAIVFPMSQGGFSQGIWSEHGEADFVSQGLPENMTEKKIMSTGLPNILARSELVNLGWGQVVNILNKRSAGEVQRETLQVYLTALLAEVNIDKKRIEDISALVNDEMSMASFSSPSRASLTS